jgi:coniferyl-aldehyde dehydrogenase
MSMAAEQIAPLIASDDLASVERCFEAQRQAFGQDPYPSLQRRLDRLDRLEKALRRHEAEIRAAIALDFGNRAEQETRLIEELACIEGIRHARHHLRGWMRPERRRAAWWALPARARVLQQPLGVIGIVVPWNYPLLLSVNPLTAALAAGNHVMIKLSEFTPRFGALFDRIITDAFSADEVSVINGDAAVAHRFSALPFDHLLFTGSTRIGREVMRQASENLTPVTLELGGKSPVIATDGFSLTEMARRIMFAKLVNAGQTCAAPDYVLLPEGREDVFIHACREATRDMYPTLAGNPQYTTVINDRQYARLAGYLTEAAAAGATVHALHDEPADAQRRSFSPVALTGAGDTLRVMQEEIFGPILPIVSYRRLDEAIAYVNARPRPLALYFFGDRNDRDQVLQRTLSGGVTINNVALHATQEDLPFGGVGASGMGEYHGRYGFLAFSKGRAILYDSRLSGSALLRPPYGRMYDFVMRLLYR